MAKKVVAIHDLAGFGRCSLTTIISALSAMGVQTCPIPVAFFSSHTALPNYYMMDLTDGVQKTVDQWAELDTCFDAVYSGFLSGEAQTEGILYAIRRLKPSLVVIDPVMGDSGRLYKTYTPALCESLRQLCRHGHVLTPNLTEIAVLLGKEPWERPIDEAQLRQWVLALAADTGASVVVTGVSFLEGRLGNLSYDGAKFHYSSHEKIQAYFPGTGDLFASVLLGYLLRGEPLAQSAEKAGKFVYDCILDTKEKATPPLFGVELEASLHLLMGEQ